MNSKFIVSNDRKVMFINFAVGQSKLAAEHVSFIERILVPFYINTIETSPFSDATITFRPVGHASITGKTDRNQSLSVARAQAVGEEIKRQFQLQKRRGPKSSAIGTVHVEPKGEGETMHSDALGANAQNAKRLPEKMVDDRSSLYRSASISLRLRHVVDEEVDSPVFCRQILNVTLKVEKVPANELERVIAQMDARMPAELRFAAGEFLAALKGLAKSALKEILKAADTTAPELFLIFKGIEFMVPSSIALLFEFKDARGQTQRYTFSGDANKVDLNAVEVLCELLSVLKWMTRLPNALEELEAEVERNKGKLNQSHEQIESLKKAIDELKKRTGQAKKLLDAMAAKDSLARRMLGDKLVDALLEQIRGPQQVELATAFSRVTLPSGVFDIHTFSGAAQTETRELFGQRTSVLLDFAAEKNISLLGFRGHVILEREFSMGLTLASFEISRGVLTPFR